MTTPNAERPALDLDAIEARALNARPEAYYNHAFQIFAKQYAKSDVLALVAELRETRRERDAAYAVLRGEATPYDAEQTQCETPHWLFDDREWEKAAGEKFEREAYRLLAERDHLRAELDTVRNLLGAEREPAAVTDEDVRVSTLREVLAEGCSNCARGEVPNDRHKHWNAETRRWLNCGHNRYMRDWLVEQIEAARRPATEAREP